MRIHVEFLHSPCHSKSIKASSFALVARSLVQISSIRVQNHTARNKVIILSLLVLRKPFQKQRKKPDNRKLMYECIFIRQRTENSVQILRHWYRKSGIKSFLRNWGAKGTHYNSINKLFLLVYLVLNDYAHLNKYGTNTTTNIY